MVCPSPSSEVLRAAQNLANDVQKTARAQGQALRLDLDDAARTAVRGTLWALVGALLLALGVPLVLGGLILFAAELLHIRPGLALLGAGGLCVGGGILAVAEIYAAMRRKIWFPRMTGAFGETRQPVSRDSYSTTV